MAWFCLNPSCLSICSQGGAEEYLLICCSDEILSEQLNAKSMQEKSFCAGRRMEYCHTSLSGMMSRLLEPITRNAQSTSRGSEESEVSFASQEDSPVKTSLLREKEPDWKERGQGYGMKCKELLARYSPDTSSWRTPQCLLFEESTECLKEFPKWGSLQDGELWELTMQEPRMLERGSGSGRKTRHIPTPTATDAHEGYRAGRNITTEENFRGVSLKWLVEQRPDKMWPTPVASDSKGSVSEERFGCYTERQKKRRLSTLKDAVKFPTPGTTGLSNGSGNCEKANLLYETGVITKEERKSFRAGNGGQLNPRWVEWLMGWVEGWTDLKKLDKEEFERWKEKAEQGLLWVYDPATCGDVPRVTEDCSQRRQRLLALGNGQVPSCACLSETVLRGLKW